MSLNDSWIIASGTQDLDLGLMRASQALFYTDTEDILMSDDLSSEELSNYYSSVDLQQARMDAFNRYRDSSDPSIKQNWSAVINKIMDALRLQTIENAAQIKLAKIVKQEDGYYVKSEKGKNLGGPYKSKEEASSRLDQVEYFKNN